jgi:hypothetical protein
MTRQMSISTNQVSSVMLRSKKLEIWEKKCGECERADKNQTGCHEIEHYMSKDRAMPEGDNPSFWDEFIKFTLIHIPKQVPKYK